MGSFSGLKKEQKRVSYRYLGTSQEGPASSSRARREAGIRNTTQMGERFSLATFSPTSLKGGFHPYQCFFIMYI